MHYRTPITLTAALLVAMALPAAAQDESATAETVVATVNGTDITLGHMIAMRSKLPQQYQNLPSDVLFNGILDQLVQQTLLSERAGGLSQANALVLENETRSLLAAQVFQEVALDALNDENLQTAYDETYGDITPEDEYNASHILVETEEEAAAVIEAIEGGADFAEEARAKSTGPSGPNGGALGWFSKGMMVPPFEAAVLELSVGEISAPVQTQFGWHVVKLNETRRKAAPTFDEVRGELSDTVQREAIEGYLSGLEDGADVTRIDPEMIDVNIITDLSLISE